MLRPLLIFGVVYVHTGGVGDNIVTEWNNAFLYCVALLRDGLARICVPVLSLVSGYLLFNANLDRNVPKMFAKKARTLLVPFLVFNLAYIAARYVAEAQFQFVPPRQSLLDAGPVEWANLAFGLATAPMNYPLYFVRDMLVLVVLAPVLGVVLRRTPVLGLLLVSAVFFTGLDGPLVLRDTSAVLFYVGGMAAVGKWDLQMFDKYAWWCVAIIVIGCVVRISFRIENYVYPLTAMAFLVWPAASLLHNTAFGKTALRYTKYSFFVFVVHAPLMFAGWEFIIRHARFIPFPVYYVFGPALTVAGIVVVYNVAMRLMPKTFSFITGGRSEVMVAPRMRAQVT